MIDDITVKIKGDSTDLDRKMAEVTKRIDQMRKLSSGGANGISPEVQEKASLNIKKMLTQELKNQASELKKSEQSYLKIDKHIKDGTFSSKQKTAELQKQSKILDDILTRSKAVNNLQSATQGPQGFQRLGTAFQKGGIGGLTTAAGRMGPGALLRLAGSAVGGALAGGGAAATTVGDWRYWKAGLPAEQAARASAIAKSATQMQGRAINEDSFEDIMFGSEDKRAFKGSMDFMEKANPARLLRARGKAALGVAGVGAGIWGGAKLGSMVGTTIAPGIGTAVGGLAGGIFGGVMSGMNIFGGNEESYYGLTNNKDALTQMTGQDAIDKYNKLRTQERIRNPNQYYQKGFLAKNKEALLATQRSAGLSDDEMFKGSDSFMQRGGQLDTFGQRAAMQRGIVGAGGSGQTSGNLHLMALQAQRNYGMTNAGQTMGKLSNYLGQNESSEAFIKILAQGVSLGLDDSKYVEEQKDYFQIVTSLAQRVGGGAEEYIAGSIAAGVGDDMSRRSVQMAGSAFAQLESDLGQQGGITGAARASALRADKTFEKIKGMDFVQLQQMKMSDINEDNSQVKSFYEKSGGDPKDKKGLAEFAKKLRAGYRKGLIGGFAGTTLGSGTEKLFEKMNTDGAELTEAEEGQLVSNIKTMIPSQANKSTKEVLAYARTLGTGESAMAAGKAEKEQITKALAKQKRIEERGFFDGGPKETMTEDETRLAKLGAKPDRKLDTMNAEVAAAQTKVLDGIDKIFDDVAQSIKDSISNKAIMDEWNTAMSGGAKAVEAFLDVLRAEVKAAEKPAKGSQTIPGNTTQKNMTTKKGSNTQKNMSTGKPATL